MQPGAAADGLSAGVSDRGIRLRDSHGSHGGTINALLLYAVASAAMPVFHAVAGGAPTPEPSAPGTGSGFGEAPVARMHQS
jgi:hypothetical protein